MHLQHVQAQAPPFSAGPTDGEANHWRMILLHSHDVSHILSHLLWVNLPSSAEYMRLSWWYVDWPLVWVHELTNWVHQTRVVIRHGKKKKLFIVLCCIAWCNSTVYVMYHDRFREQHHSKKKNSKREYTLMQWVFSMLAGKRCAPTTWQH